MISLRARRVACLIWMMAGRYDLHRVPLAALVTALLRVPYAHRGARPRQVVVAAAAQSTWSTFTLTYLDRSTAAPRLRLHRGPDPCLFTARDFVDCAQFASAACYTHIGRLEVNAVTAIGGRRPLVRFLHGLQLNSKRKSERRIAREAPGKTRARARHAGRMDELTDRLIASRYGELAFLRALAVVETNKDTVTTFFQHRATRDERATTRATTAREEVMRVAASRCVSGMAAAFRTSLESSLSRQAVPRAAASQNHRNLISEVANTFFHGNSRTTALREANSAPVPPPVDDPVQTMPPSTVPVPVEFESGGRGGRADTLDELRALGHVGRMLRNAFFRERIESVLLSNVENPNVSTVTNRLYPNLRGGRGLSPTEGAARARVRTDGGRAAAPVEQPQMAAMAALHGTPPSLTGNPTLDNLTLVTGASFELLLSIQRMLQQELGAALRHTNLDVPAVTDHAISGMAAMAAAATPAVMSNATADGGTSSGSGSGSDFSWLGFVNGSVRPSVRRSPTSRRTFPLGACVICIEAEVSTVFYKCGHMCACNRCAFTLKQRRAKCPICRAPITDVIQAFIACPPPEVSAAEEVASESVESA